MRDIDDQYILWWKLSSETLSFNEHDSRRNFKPKEKARQINATLRSLNQSIKWTMEVCGKRKLMIWCLWSWLCSMENWLRIKIAFSDIPWGVTPSELQRLLWEEGTYFDDLEVFSSEYSTLLMREFTGRMAWANDEAANICATIVLTGRRTGLCLVCAILGCRWWDERDCLNYSVVY